MKVSGFALVRDVDSAEVQWWEEIPPRFEIPGARLVVFGADKNWRVYGHHIVPREREMADPPDVNPSLDPPKLSPPMRQ